jgi:hypothetical protein
MVFFSWKEFCLGKLMACLENANNLADFVGCSVFILARALLF